MKNSNWENLTPCQMVVRILVHVILIIIAMHLFGCSTENAAIRKTQREMRGEGKHRYKGGPFQQNKQFTGYQY